MRWKARQVVMIVIRHELHKAHMLKVFADVMQSIVMIHDMNTHTSSMLGQISWCLAGRSCPSVDSKNVSFALQQ